MASLMPGGMVNQKRSANEQTCQVFYCNRIDNVFQLKRKITVDVNGKKVLSKDISEVDGNVKLYTSPRVGPPPAEGIIRAVTVITDEDYGQLENSVTDSPTSPFPPERIKVTSCSTMKTCNGGLLQILLHSDDKFEYYKVAVANGTRLTEGKVSQHLETQD